MHSFRERRSDVFFFEVSEPMRGCDGRFRSTNQLKQCSAEAEAQLGSLMQTCQG